MQRMRVERLTSFEKLILSELQEKTGRRKLRAKDLLEWRTSEIKPQNDNEEVHVLSVCRVWATIPKKGPVTTMSRSTQAKVRTKFNAAGK